MSLVVILRFTFSVYTKSNTEKRGEKRHEKSTSLSESAFRCIETLSVIEDVSVFKIVAIHEKVACKSGVVKIATHQF